MGLDDANPALEDRQPLVAAPRKHGAAVCQRCRRMPPQRADPLMERMVTVEGRPVRYLDAGTGPADLAAAHLELVDQVTGDLAREL